MLAAPEPRLMHFHAVKMGLIVSSFCNQLFKSQQDTAETHESSDTPQPQLESDNEPVIHSQQQALNMQQKSHLLKVVEDGTFWTLPDSELLQVVKQEFPDELEHLKHAYSVRQAGLQEKPGSPSRVLYPDEGPYDEVNRSLVGVLALRWVNDNNYEKFAGGQPQPVRLRQESFTWIRSIFEQQGMINSRSYKLYALITSMVSNDLGKSTSFVKSYHDLTGKDIKNENHDMILYKATQKNMVSALERLNPEIRDEIKLGIKLGAEFNVGQLAQAEDAPASMVPILDLIDHEDAWNMRWMEQLLDLAGAAGHEDHSCASKLIEPIFRSYRSVYDIVMGIVQGKLTLRQGYDQNLVTRYNLIMSSGWQPPKPMSVDQPQDRALMRIFCMGNAADAQTAGLYYKMFYSDLVGEKARQQLTQYLNREGTVEEPAVQPTYGPAMMTLSLGNLAKSPRKESADYEEHRQRTAAALLRYLARVFSKPPSSEMVEEGDVTVIERDCRVAVKHIIQSEEFLNCPEVLDDAPLPEDAVANRSKESDT